MTAWVLKPGSPAPANDDAVVNRYPYLDNSRREGNLFAGAVIVAMAIHVVAFWLPLPSRAALPVAEPTNDPTVLHTTPLIPPPPPEPVRAPEPEHKPPQQSLPVPAPPDYLEPVVEQPMEIPNAPVVVDGDPIDLASPEPPPVASAIPELVEESHAGLDVPVAVSKPSPAYPRAAVTVRAEAEVVLEAIVDRAGNVTDVRLISVIGGVDLGFSEAAIDAVSRWVYRPGTIDGKPVAVRLTVRVSFSLR